MPGPQIKILLQLLVNDGPKSIGSSWVYDAQALWQLHRRGLVETLRFTRVQLTKAGRKTAVQLAELPLGLRRTK